MITVRSHRARKDFPYRNKSTSRRREVQVLTTQEGGYKRKRKPTARLTRERRNGWSARGEKVGKQATGSVILLRRGANHLKSHPRRCSMY